MKRLTAIIEKNSDGRYGIYTFTGISTWGYGMTEVEARQNFLHVLEEQARQYKEEHGVNPDWYRHIYRFEYRYDMSQFFLRFPFINVSAFAEFIGVQPSLMRKYKSGLATASNAQKEYIQDKFDEIISNIEAVKF